MAQNNKGRDQYQNSTEHLCASYTEQNCFSYCVIYHDNNDEIIALRLADTPDDAIYAWFDSEERGSSYPLTNKG